MICWDRDWWTKIYTMPLSHTYELTFPSTSWTAHARGYATTRALIEDSRALVPQAMWSGVRPRQSTVLGASGHSLMINSTRCEGRLPYRIAEWRIVIPLSPGELEMRSAQVVNTNGSFNNRYSRLLQFCVSMVVRRTVRYVISSVGMVEVRIEETYSTARRPVL